MMSILSSLRRPRTLLLLGLPLLGLPLLGLPLALLAGTLHLPDIAIAGLLLPPLLPLASFLQAALVRLDELAHPRGGESVVSALVQDADDVAIGLAVLLPLSGAGASGAIEGTVVGALQLDLLVATGVASFLGALRNGRMTYSMGEVQGYVSLLALPAVTTLLPTMLYGPMASGPAIPLTVVVAAMLIASYVGFLAQDGSGADPLAWIRRAVPTPPWRPIRVPASPAAPGGPVGGPVGDARIDAAGPSGHEGHEAKRRRRGRRRAGRIAAVSVAALASAAAFVGASIWFNAALQGAFDHDPGLRGYQLFAGVILVPLLLGAGDIAPLVVAARSGEMEEVMAVTCGSAYRTVAGIVPTMLLAAFALGHPVALTVDPFGGVLIFVILAYFWLLCGSGEITALGALSLCLLWGWVAIATLPMGR